MPGFDDDQLMSRKRPTHWLCGGSSGDEYEAAFDAMAARGQDMHGEARFVAGFHPRTVLDAGCGTGRVARELARQGMDVVGVDVNPGMLATAQRKAPDLEWHLGDLATVELERTFDVVLLAGNVMIFLVPGSEGAVVANMSKHLNRDGRLIAGFQLDFGLSFDEYDAMAATAGLMLVERWATWDREPSRADDRYAVSVHRPAGAADSLRCNVRPGELAH